MKAIQFTLEDLPHDPDKRLEIVIEALVARFLPSLADRAELDVYELQSILATELAYQAGVTLKPESALQMIAMLAQAVHAGAIESSDESASIEESDLSPAPVDIKNIFH